MRSHIGTLARASIAMVVAVLPGLAARAQVVFFDGSTSANWLVTNNWTPSGVPSTTAIAQFGATPAGPFNIAMNSANTNNGTANQAVGAVWITSARTTDWVFGNNSITSNGTFTLNGAAIPGVGDAVLYHNGGTSAAPTTMSFVDAVGGGNKLFDVMLPAGGNIRIRTGDGLTGANFGNTIQTDGSFHSLQAFTVLGGGNGSNRPGTFSINHINNSIGSFTVGSADGLDAGRLRLAWGQAATGTWTINPHSQLHIDNGGIGSSVNPGTLVLKSMGLASSSANFLPGAVRFTAANAAINGLIQLQANSGIHNEGTLDVPQAITQSGGTFSLTKTGAGNMILSQPCTYGDTFISAGSITIDGGNNRLPTTSNVSITSGASLILGTSSAARTQQLRSVTGAGSVVGAFSTNSTLQVSTGSGTFTGLLGGAGTNQNRLALALLNSAFLELARPAGNTYLGTTTVSSSATLRVSNTSGSATGTGNVTVNTGGKLEGLGSITGTVTATGGIIAPGTSTARGPLTVGNTTFNGSASLVLDLLSPGSYDSLNVVGTIAAGGAALTLSMSPTLAPGGTDKFWLITNDGTDAIGSVFGGFPNGTIIIFPNGAEGTLSYFGNSATGALTGGNDLVIALPSPSICSLLALGGLIATRRRRN